MFSETVEICGDVLRDKSGSVTAPDSDSDGQYDKNANCYWTIEAEEGYVVRYRINFVNIEDTNSEDGYCADDFVLVSYPYIPSGPFHSY